MIKKEAYDKPGPLMERTRELLKKDPRGLPGVYLATSLPFYWLKKFAAGEFRNPSVNRVQYLYEQLTGSALQIH